MRYRYLIKLVSSIFILLLYVSCCAEGSNRERKLQNGEIALPPVKVSTKGTLSHAVYNRRSVRKFSGKPLTLEQLSAVLWAGGGKTIDGISGATRSYAAAGGIYPLEFYLVVENVTDLKKGIYHYKWKNHTIIPVHSGSFMKDISEASFSRSFRSSSRSSTAPACIVITADPTMTVSRYGKRGASRYIPMAVGGAGQTISLQAVSLNLGTYIIGAFDDDKIQRALKFKNNENIPMYLMPIGIPDK